MPPTWQALKSSVSPSQECGDVEGANLVTWLLQHPVYLGGVWGLGWNTLYSPKSSAGDWLRLPQLE